MLRFKADFELFIKSGWVGVRSGNNVVKDFWRIKKTHLSRFVFLI